MDLNAVEQYLKNNNTFFASIKVLSRKLNIDKKRIKWFIAFSTHLKAVEPIRIGSGKSYLPIFEYHEYPDSGMLFYNRRKMILSRQKKKTVIED